MVQVLQRSNFDYQNDTLIVLGDVCDGWSEVAECFETLLKIPNLIYIEGNHDQWFMDYATNQMGRDSMMHWFKFGGIATHDSYKKNNNFFDKHVNFLKSNALKYHIDGKNRVFVHAGIPNHHTTLDVQDDYAWTRHFFNNAKTWNHQNYKISIPIDKLNPDLKTEHWFVGHTPVAEFNDVRGNVPITYSNITFVDTGAAFDGFLTMINVDDINEIVQSDRCMTLYPTEKGRNKVSYNDRNKNLYNK